MVWEFVVPFNGSSRRACSYSSAPSVRVRYPFWKWETITRGETASTEPMGGTNGDSAGNRRDQNKKRYPNNIRGNGHKLSQLKKGIWLEYRILSKICLANE